MTTTNALLFLTAETSIHAGAGQSLSAIDLPIQRESHSNWPCVFGSAVKGALRARAESSTTVSKSDITELFGPDHAAAAGERDSAHAGALLVGDARLLALPVRSLQSCYKLVTCPTALRRFQRDAERLQVKIPTFTIPAVDISQALGEKSNTLFLEEFRLHQQQSDIIATLAKGFAAINGGATDAEQLAARIVIVHDDVFSFLVNNATAVTPHIAIDSQTKTVKDGMLWHEESLPPETLLYIALTATPSRVKNSVRQSQEVLTRFCQLLPAGNNWLQLGGNETTGMGWCRVGITVQN